MTDKINKLKNIKQIVSDLTIDKKNQIIAIVNDISIIGSDKLNVNFKNEIIEKFTLSSTYFNLEDLKVAENENWNTSIIFLNSKIDELINLYTNEIKLDESKQFFDTNLLKQLKTKTSINDYGKLIRFCEEVNINYQSKCYLSVIILLRAILNYIPPLFGETVFHQVVIKHKPAPRKNKNEILEALEINMRKFGDLHNHQIFEIGKPQLLPSINQIETFKPNFEYLLQEIISK